MHVVILAGGFGTRLSEETELKPKPMVEVGGWPILCHVLEHYAFHGHNEFFVALGYKGESIKRYFRDYYALGGDLTVDLKTGAVDHHERVTEDWKVHLIDTGANVMTGGRVARLEGHLAGAPFMLTYGDGVSNVDIAGLLKFHRAQGKIATVTAVRPPARFGGLVFEGDLVKEFTEKPQIGEGWINGGFMVFEPAIFEYFKAYPDRDACVLEADILEQLAKDGQLAAYRHDSYWQCMDTVRDLRILESQWHTGDPPWRKRS